MIVPTVSIVVPVYNGGENFCRCLNAIQNASPQPSEVIVVCDASTDKSAEIAQTYGYRVIQLTRQSGPARARNVGARAATGDLIFFVDADVEIYPYTVGQIQQYFQQNEKLDALIGSYDAMPGAPNFLSQYRNLLHHWTHQQSNRSANTFWGACGAIRRTVFYEIGGFDEAFVEPSIEDIELGYRLVNAGHTIHLCKEIQIKHLKEWRAKSIIQTDIMQRALPWSRLLLSEGRLDNDLNLRFSERISVSLVFSIVCLLMLSILWAPFLLLLPLIAFPLLWLNFWLYDFFLRERGARFTIYAILWHWFYYLYSGSAYAVALIHHRIETVFASSGNLYGRENVAQ